MNSTIIRAAILALCCLAIRTAAAQQVQDDGVYRQGFDDDRTSWKLSYDRTQVALIGHRRDRRVRVAGESSEHATFEVRSRGSQVALEHNLPASRLFDDLKVSLWFKSNQNGAQLSFRVVFPHQKDPRNGRVLSTLISGERYTKASHWQKITCQIEGPQFRDHLIRLRAQLRPKIINARDPYVVSVVIKTPLRPGTTELFFDELNYGPVVAPTQRTPIVQVGVENERLPVRFRLDRLLIEGRPTFLRIMPYHGEDLDRLKATGVNIVWIPDSSDTELLEQLLKRKLWAMAVPPGLTEAQFDSDVQSRLPYSSSTSPILMWYLGTHIRPDQRKEVARFASMIRSADRKMRRPLIADVTGLEDIYSRQLNMIGSSREDFINGSLSLRQYRDWLHDKSLIAQPGSFRWAWIKTESPTSLNRRELGFAPMVIEPEQIRMQVYAAIAAGCRGIGFEKTRPLGSDSLGSRERELIISQLCLELELLEPWLATGTLDDQIPVIVPGSTTNRSSTVARSIFSRTKRSKKHDRETSTSLPLLEAAHLQNDNGHLLLPIFYQPNAQLVPGQMVVENATVLVPGVYQTASAWEITTTRIESLKAERVTGGLKITIPRIDQTTAIIVTSNRNLIGILRKKKDAMQAKSARITIDLARAKLQRVQAVDRELRSMGSHYRHGPQHLREANSAIQYSEKIYKRATDAGDSRTQPNLQTTYRGKDYDEARTWARIALQTLRILQRAQWDEIVGRLSSPVSSPHTLCYQTLPNHLRLIERLGRSPIEPDRNALPSGDFENTDPQVMIDDGWRHDENEMAGVRATAELALLSRRGNYCLRLIAVPETNEDPPSVVLKSPVTVTTPAIMVQRGQIVFVSGWARVATAITGNVEGATVSDNLLGPIAALRWNEKRDWHKFHFFREVHQDGKFKLRLALHGLGEIQFDDLRVVLLDPRPKVVVPIKDEKPEETRSLSLDFFQRLPNLNSLKPSRRRTNR